MASVTRKKMFLREKALLFIVLCLSAIDISSCFNCSHSNHDLTPLNRTWTSKSDDGVTNITYYISLCAPLVPNGADQAHCHSNTSVCVVFANGTALSAGNFTDEIRAQATEAEDELWIVNNGDPCPESPNLNMTSSINLKCGPTMGSPKFLSYIYCTSYFEWESHVYCKGDNKPVKEVPCYLYDDKGRYDLSPLSKTSGGYLISTESDDTAVYINVCRDINPVGVTASCPVGSGACRKNRNSYIGLGEPTEGLQRATDGRLILKYTSTKDENMEGCTSSPTTTIIFICPKRGASKEALIVNDFNCQYVIEWETEFACPEAMLTNDSCVLTKEAAGIDIDLRPLTKLPADDHPYKTNYTDHGTVYDYFLNICADTGVPCPDHDHVTNIPACQTKPSDSHFGQIMGSTQHTQLRYADGDLTLTYKGGAVCHHNNFKRETVIKFICKQDAANDGAGGPVFVKDDDCIYMFNWETKYACVDEQIDESCRVNVKGKRYDLSSLVKKSGMNWEALHPAGAVDSYYINVCHNIIPEGVASQCDPGAAICFKGRQGAVNLGRYSQPPVYDNKTNTVQITYTGGDTCANNKRITSTVMFFCKPGDLDSGPSLIHKSNDGCLYDFQWYTAAACVLGHYTGDNCKVYDDVAGFSFDLTPLRQPVNKPYIVDNPADANHDYLLNVCGAVTGTKCDNVSTPNVGICQSPKDGKDGAAFNIGQFSTKLSYFDGMINLTYTDGTPYNDNASTPRKSEITFICDQSAGKGTPTYLSEVTSGHYYGFEWRTAYACPTVQMECTATDEKSHQEYDLSGLSMSSSQGNWVVESTGKTKYYINVCRSLNEVKVGTGCDTSAAVCTTQVDSNGQESIDVTNMGQVKNSLVVEGEGRLKLTYEGGMCNNGSANVPYVTTVQFLCRKDAVVSTPSVPIKDGPCSHTILWNTASACPLVKDTDMDKCTAKDPNSDYIFNLQPLTKPGGDAYTVKVGDDQYKIKICGNLSSDVCPADENGKPASVCLVKKDGSKSSLSASGYNLDFSETGQMLLIYEGTRLGNGQVVNVQINFQCAPDIDLGQPQFIRKEENTYMFNFLTSLACPPMGTDCFVQDESGNQYDLSGLSRDDGWTVLDNTGDTTKYYINVCRPVNNFPDARCPDGPIGGCQSAANNLSYNMGYIQSKPIARSDGTLTIHYRNGDVCHKDTPNESHRSTRINFFCSVTEEGPAYASETATCEYVFNWRTPAACPLKTSSGANCKVVDPRYNYEFDLNPLRKAGSDYHVANNDYVYLINVCGPLLETGSCDLGSGVGACQSKPTDTSFTAVNTGKGNSNLTYSAGELTLTYTGGKDSCHGKYTRQTIIKFTCDPTKDGTAGPLFIEESVNCKYIFEWPTHHACPPFKEGRCSVSDKQGNNYDLSGLTLLTDNYGFTDTREKKRYLINVCRSLVQKANATCPYNAAACMVDLDKPESASDKYQSIGEVNNNQVQYDNGRLYLVYQNGELCSNGKDKMTTHVLFICDENSKMTSPAGHFMVGDCDHHFMWTSSLACQMKDVKPPSPPSGPTTGNTSCSVTDPTTGQVFDLSRLTLHDSSYKVHDGKGHLLEFDVCGPVAGSSCHNKSSNMGVCQSETTGLMRTFNAGNAVGNLWFDDGTVVYTLPGGDRCHGGQFERSTVISFVCNHDTLGRPVYLDETKDCTYYIAWHTDLVCPPDQIKCSVDIGGNSGTLDLSPLSRADHVVTSTQSGATFYLSVCKPLSPMAGVLCPQGSSVCQIKPNDTKLHTSLGRPKSAPTYNHNTGDVTIMYEHGSVCDTDKTKNYTSQLVISCTQGEANTSPVFVAKTGCAYIFHWDTPVVCTGEKPTTAPSGVTLPPGGKTTPKGDYCGYHDYRYNRFYNFNNLQGESPFTVKDLATNKQYQINMCGTVPGCGSAMVCDSKNISYGEPKNYTVISEGNMLKLLFASGVVCQGTSHYQTEVLLKCDRGVDDMGKPEYMAGIGCHIQLYWRTPVVCPPLDNPCSIIVDGHLFDLGLLTKDKGAWNVTDSKKIKYFINICGPVSDMGKTDCGLGTGACRETPDGKMDKLGSVLAQKDLLHNEKGDIILEYDEGGPACTHGKRRSNNPSAKTKITFKCGTTFGAPVFVESPANEEECVFEFTWKTSLACKVERIHAKILDGKLKDTRSGGEININPILNTSYTVHDKVKSVDNIYKIRLDGQSPDCVNGVICHVKDQQHISVLGTHASMKFYFDDEVLEATLNGSAKCSGDQSTKNVSSIIQFHCSIKQENPQLLHNYKDCFYIFVWETPMACLTASIEDLLPISGGSGTPGSHAGTDGSQNTSGGSPSSKTVGGIVGVFMTAIIICILLVVFHKQERRTACYSGVRNIFGRNRSEYTQLPTDATDLLGDIGDDIITITDASETESNRRDRDEYRDEDPLVTVETTPAGYHDDSDEDLLA